MQHEHSQVKRKKWYFRWWMWIIYIFIFFVVLGSIGGSPSENVPSSTPQVVEEVPEQPKVVITVSAVKLYQDYKANEVAADVKYKGNTLKVSGEVDSIGKDILDTPYITLKADQYGISNVQCMFSKKDVAVLAQVTQDTQITLQGTSAGLALLSPILRGCQIVQ